MKKYWAVAVCLLAVLSVTTYFRSYPVFLPQLRASAEMSIDRQISQNIFGDINKTYPNLDDLAKARLFERALAGYKKENKESIKKRTQEEYDKIKDRFQDRSGRTYLMELDGWDWARFVVNIGRNDGIGDEVRNGKQYDNHMLFPQGASVDGNPFFYYLCWYLYKLFFLIHPIALMGFLFYLPLFFMSVFTVTLYLFCWRNWSNLVAIVSCLFVGLAPILLPRSCAGWFDTDTLNMLFPVLIIWTYLLSYSDSSWKRSVFWVVFSSFFLSLFCGLWSGWSFILFIILLYEIIVIANCFSERLQYGKKVSVEIKKHLIIAAVFLFSGALWVFIFSGISPFEALSEQVKGALALNSPLTSLIWPNVFSTVGELKSGDYLTIARSVGGVIPLALTLVLMLGLFLNIKKYSGMKRELLLMMVVWFMTMFFFCSKGIRFSIFLLVPLGIFLGWGIDELCQFSLSKKWRLVLIPLFLLVAGIISSFISTADSAAKNCLPLMDDSWFSALTTIKKYTPPGSVINSWWDFGDWFMSVADRPVIFDGQTQNTPQAYWMARAILADSEKESVGILRMLNNGGNKAFDIIDKYVGNPFMSVSLLKRAVLLDSDEGSVLFGKYLPADAVKEACQILYSRPEQKAYFIVDSSMIGKITAISFLGNWDFNKVYLSRAIRVKSKDQILRDLLFYGLDQSQAQAYYQEASLMASRDFNSWVSRRMSISGIAYQKKSEDGLVLFNNGYIYNPEKKTIYSYSSYEERYRIPRSLFMADGNNITEEVFSGSDSSQSAMVIRFGEMYKLLLMSPELARSVFVRLQFFNGRGLNHFVPFIREGPADNQILVYEVKWD